MTTDRRADVLRTFDRLDIDAADHELRDRIARLLGFEWIPARAQRPSSSGPTAPAATVAPLQTTPQQKKPRQPPPPPVQPPSDPTPESFHLTRVESADRRPPAWMHAARPLQHVEALAMAKPLRVDPLLDPVQARAILSAALARRVDDGPLDIVRIIERICRGEAVMKVPRTPVPSIARGVQLLIDRGDGMAPYASDLVWIREALDRVVGGYALEVLQFTDSPMRGAGRKSRRTWKPYAQLTPPRPGATIVAVTDLGIRNLAPPAHPATVEEWVAFADHLDRQGCPLIALVPYPSSRWPDALRRRFAIVEWDRRTTAGRVRAMFARGLP